MNPAVAIYVAHGRGISLAPSTIAAGAAVAAITTIGSVSLPGQVSFLTSIAPICVAMGIPIEPLALLIAVEMIPDLRSEEHTSELQSLMRNSYAVFCLKKKLLRDRKHTRLNYRNSF